MFVNVFHSIFCRLDPVESFLVVFDFAKLVDLVIIGTYFYSGGGFMNFINRDQQKKTQQNTFHFAYRADDLEY